MWTTLYSQQLTVYVKVVSRATVASAVALFMPEGVAGTVHVPVTASQVGNGFGRPVKLPLPSDLHWMRTSAG